MASAVFVPTFVHSLKPLSVTNATLATVTCAPHLSVSLCSEGSFDNTDANVSSCMIITM